jgi:mRNA interferase MazF
VICEFGDVVIVPFPFVDVAAEKRRPAAVISHAIFNGSHGHSILAMITTAAGTKWPSDIVIEDYEDAGLNRPCFIRWKLFALPNEFIIRRAGSLTSSDRKNVTTSAHAVIA